MFLYLQQGSLKEHEPTCDEEPSCSYKKYNKPFTPHTTLNMDEKSHNDDCSYRCNVFNKLMNTDGDLESHKSFSEKGYQRRLQSIHIAECHYSCDVCHKSCRQKGDVRRPQCKLVGEHRYSCDVCNKLFCQVSKLKIHQRTHRGEHPHSCDVCHKTFMKKVGLMRHLRIHSGECPYVCDCKGRSQSSLFT